MYKILFASLLLFTTVLKAQDNGEVIHNFFMNTAPKIKNTTLTLVNGKYSFSTAKWAVVKNKDLYADLFAIENDKIWTGQTVSQVRILGWWGLSEAQSAYVYAYDLVDADGIKTTSVFLTTHHGIKGKTADINPFTLNPNPTGMKGKITNTATLSINTFGIIKLVTSHKNSNGKILKKESTFSVDEDGKINKN